MKKVLVFFDGNCTICSKEINFYKKKDFGKKIFWVDINKNRSLLQKYEISFNDSLLYLHVINKDGITEIGVEGFITIWKELEKFKFLIFFLNFKPIKRIISTLYKYWAQKRFKNLSYKCDLS